tara:strand:+ start:900 stop:1523 length:624 start_codon:yes stop_codon:yes gene_type:complete
MKIINCEQGSDEWLEIRKGVATASNFSRLLTPKTEKPSSSINKYAKELALELTYEELKVNSFKSAAMEDGNLREGLARQAYQEAKVLKVNEVGFMISDCGNFGYSPDGVVGKDGLIEVKCLEAEAHSEILLSSPLQMPVIYKCQIQGGLWISGRKWCDFVAYGKVKKKERNLIIIRIFRDEDFIKKLEVEVKKCITLRDEIINKINN